MHHLKHMIEELFVNKNYKKNQSLEIKEWYKKRPKNVC